MNSMAGVDSGKLIDWNRASEDYARYRPGPAGQLLQNPQRAANRRTRPASS